MSLQKNTLHKKTNTKTMKVSFYLDYVQIIISSVPWKLVICSLLFYSLLMTSFSALLSFLFYDLFYVNFKLTYQTFS